MNILNKSAQVMLEFKSNNNLTDGEFTNLLKQVNEYNHQLEDCVVYANYEAYIQCELSEIKDMIVEETADIPYAEIIGDMFNNYVKDMNDEALARTFGIGLNDTIIELDNSDKVVVVD